MVSGRFAHPFSTISGPRLTDCTSAQIALRWNVFPALNAVFNKSAILLIGAQLGSAACVKLTQTDATTPTDSRVVMNPTAGQTLQVQIMRDSAGSNFGGVYPQTATVAAWGVAPSALLVISRLEPVTSP